MPTREKEKLQALVGLVDRIASDPDVDIDYFIPGVLVTEGSDGHKETGGPYVQFSYRCDGRDKHVQHVPLTHGYLDKEPEDLANFITFSLERFKEEIDSRQYGAQ